MTEMTTVRRSRAAFTAKDITLISMFTVIIAVCSWISVPVSIPFTLQTFAVFCALLMTGGKRGTFSVIVFIMLAAVGVPVLSGFTGGIGVLIGSTGGYILGFLLMGLIYWGAEHIFGEIFNLPIKITVLIIGLLVCYLFGTAWFIVIYTRTSGTVSIGEAFMWCVKPFIIPDLLKLALSILISEHVRKYVDI